ncbi:hypothetical protein RM844_27135 [Streptomyces sp. DSM 44915]|uniref:Uncharacterized protein n=1 Tax=Streptomyces chisholmiae TaxID=3075540 RepID=A0ABU2JYC1_9ACTN|nr:hypothetical protein [Streptomyces sp. DSM 44915]MDT0269960.1 hypothetical protein [Streptomyces sp. DSM 44915]
MNTEQGSRSFPASPLAHAQARAVPPPPTVPPPPGRPPQPAAPAAPFAVPPGYPAPPPPYAPPPPAGRPPVPGRAWRALGARLPGRMAGAVLCLVLGTGLLGGAAAGAWLAGDDGSEAAAGVWESGRDLWRELPVDELFPPELTATGAGPGGADRRWLRLGVAPDSGCAEAFDPLLAEVLSGAGCHRLIRATYTDETETTVTTVGLLFTTADPAGMTLLADRFAGEELATRTDLLPRTFPVDGSVAEEFGDPQRAAWTIEVADQLPVVAWAVTGFADGRQVEAPEPAAEATADGADSGVALAGLGHDTQGIADGVVDRLHQAHEARTGDGA